MNINLVKSFRGAEEHIEVEKGATIEELYYKIKDEVPYQIVGAKINNKVESLRYIVKEECRVELLDMRDQNANMIYQNSLILLYLRAVQCVFGDVAVDIDNAINQGLYTKVGLSEITEEDVDAIKVKMDELVRSNLPIVEEQLSKEEATAFFRRRGCEEKVDLLDEITGNIVFYNLDGYKEMFYGHAVPSTGYLKYYELRKYKSGILLRMPQQSLPDAIAPYSDEKMLYKTFGEQHEWGEIMKINYVCDLNKRIKEGKFTELVQLSEALHEKRIIEIAEMINKQRKRIVLIAGPSSSGKTTFAQRLCIQLRVCGLDPIYMGTDDYFVEREDTPLDEYGEKNYEDLEAVDVKLFNSNMKDLLEGKTVDMPTFDFITGKKIFGKRMTTINSNQILVIEGIHALNEVLTAEIPKEDKFKIYISPLTQLNIDRHNRIVTTDHRMLRRLVRDYKYRGHSAKSTISNWPKVRAGEDKNIFPYSNEADVLFNSSHLYEISVLKKYAKPLLESVSPEDEEYGDAERLLNFLMFFQTVDDDSAIVNNSILREFIGGSIFVD